MARAHGPSSLKAGFDQDVETSRLPREAVIIKAWAIDWETQKRLSDRGVIQLERPPLKFRSVSPAHFGIQITKRRET